MFVLDSLGALQLQVEGTRFLNALQLVSANVRAWSWDIAVHLERKHFCIFKVTESQCMEHPVSL